jgi:hypothetical protein
MSSQHQQNLKQNATQIEESQINALLNQTANLNTTITQNNNKASILATPSTSSSKIKQKSSILLSYRHESNDKNSQTPQSALKNNKKTKKTVRFSEQTQFFNENKPEIKNNEKCHFIVQDIKRSDPSIGKNVTVRRRNISSNSNSTIGSQVSSIFSFNFESASVYKSSFKSSNKSSGSPDDEHLSEPSIPSIPNTNDTILYQEDQEYEDVDDNETTLSNVTLNQSKSNFEYDSILFPRAAKYVDYLSCTQDMNTIIEDRDEEQDSLPSQKESKKDKKIFQALQVSPTQKGTSSLTVMSLEVHVNTRGIFIFIKNLGLC